MILAQLLISAFCAIAWPQVPSPESLPFEKDILAYEAADAKSPPAKGGIVFVGSSSIRLWTSLSKDFPKHNVINRGFGGSQLSDSVRYADRVVTPYEPKKVFLFAGTNDIANGKSPEAVSADFKAFVTMVRAKLPAVPIAYIAISPAPSRWAKIAEIKRTNELIEAETKKSKFLHFVNTFPHMIDSQGKPRKELYVEDELHLNQKGYALWRDIIAPFMPPQDARERLQHRPQASSRYAPKLGWVAH